MVHANQAAVLEHGKDGNEFGSDELVLRICSPLRRGQIVRLKSRKCSIGSAQNCTLRLTARGVHAVHCLIVRGKRDALIRCWAPDTRINGRAFTDADLHAGDRLTIGPVEFEVLQTGTSSETTISDDAKATDISAAQPQADLAAQFAEEQKSFQQQKQQFSEELAVQRAELEQERQSLQRQQTELGEQAESLQRQRSELAEQTETIQQQRNELTQESESLQRQRREWDESQQQITEQSEQLGRLQEHLATEKAEITEQSETVQRHRDELAEKHEDLQRQRDELEQQRQSLQRQQTELGEQADALQRQRSELAEQTAQVETICEQQDEPVEQINIEQSQPSPISSEAPVNLDSVLGKMGLELERPEKQLKQSVPSTSTADEQTSTATTTKLPEVPSNNASTEDDEKLLESYMANLMERVRSINHSSSTTATDVSKEPQGHAAQDSQEATDVSAAAHNQKRPSAATLAFSSAEASEAAESTVEKLHDLSPRVAAPEQLESLSTMREIAKVSAQTAIERHAKRQFRHAARSKLLVAVVGLLASGVILYLWWFAGQRGLFFYSGLIAFMVALLWGLQFATISGKIPPTKTTDRQAPNNNSG